jgi:hypothetical protein
MGAVRGAAACSGPDGQESARWSIDSFAPVFPEFSTPSRSSTDLKRDVMVNVVVPSCS